MEHFYHHIEGWSHEADQGALLDLALSMLPSNRRLRIGEIGVYKGRCTAMWNVKLINAGYDYEYYAIDHFQGSPEHDKTVDYYAAAKHNLSKVLDRIHLIKADSLTQSKVYPDQFFDLLYIDAAHEYKPVKQDIKHWLPKVAPGGVICGDDYVAGWPGVIKAVDEAFGKSVNRLGGQQWWVQKKPSLLQSVATFLRVT